MQSVPHYIMHRLRGGEAAELTSVAVGLSQILTATSDEFELLTSGRGPAFLITNVSRTHNKKIF